MGAPLDIANSLIVTPAAVGPYLPSYTPLVLTAGTSFAASWAWINEQVGQDLSTANCTLNAIFRQLPTDSPLVSVSTTSTAQGGFSYQASVPNFPYLPPSYSGTGDAPVPITLFPFQMNLTASGISAIAAVPYCQWICEATYPDGSAVALMMGPVMVEAV